MRTRSARLCPVLALILLALGYTGLARAQPRVERILPFEEEVRALARIGDTLVLAGPGADGRAWYALVDVSTLEIRRTVRVTCHRCAFFDAVPLPDGRLALVGSRQETPTVPARAWLAVLDPTSATLVEERRVGTGGPARFVAADFDAGVLLAVGEREPFMGAEVTGLAAAFEGPDLHLTGVWPFEGRTPRAAQAALVLGPEDFLAGGWMLDPERGALAGWLARFGFKGEPVWHRPLAGAEGFEASVLLRGGKTPWLVGHAAHMKDGNLRFRPHMARIALADGSLEARSAPDDGMDRMVAAALPDDAGLLIAAATSPAPAEPERAELLRVDEAGHWQSLLRLAMDDRATLPARLLRLDADSLVMGGWLRGERAPRGWLALLREDHGSAAGEPLRLSLTCGPPGRLRVRLENRGRETIRVRPLRADTVRLVPAEPAPKTGPVGAVPGRPPDSTALTDRVPLAGGAHLALDLPLPDGPVRAVYSPDFTGYGLGRLLVSEPFAPREAACRLPTD